MTYVALLLLCVSLSWLSLCSGRNKIVRPDWKITCYVQFNTATIRAVSAAQGSYVFEGQIWYAWQDDSLRDPVMGDYGDATTYDASVGETSKYWPGTSTYQIKDSASPSFGVHGKTPYPQVTPNVKNLLTSSKNVIQWETQYDTPDWISEVPKDAVSGASSCWVVGKQEVSMVIAQPQVIKFSLENTNVEKTDMDFKFTQSTASLVSPSATIDGYTLVDQSTGYYTSSNTQSGIKVSWTLKRIPDVFFNRFVLPLVLVSTLILLLQFANTSARAMSAFTVIGTTTSFLFISSNSVPQLPYRTRLDNYFTFQFVLAFVLGVWNIYSTHNVDRFKEAYILKFSPKEEEEGGKDKKSNVIKDAVPTAGLFNMFRTSQVKVKVDEVSSAVPVVGVDNDSENPAPKEVKEDKKDKDKAKDDDRDPGSLLSKILAFHKEGKADEKKKTKQKKEDLQKMERIHLRYDVTAASFLVIVYVVCVSCIFLA